VTAAELARHRQKLLELRASLLAEGDLKIEPGRKDATAVGTDEDEQPLAEMSQTIASSRNRTRAATLARVTAALARLENEPGSFGLCQECDEPIAAKRLSALPYVELCVDCQQGKDDPRGGTRRSLTDFR
jgi:DnaK suppressor protein